MNFQTVILDLNISETFKDVIPGTHHNFEFLVLRNQKISGEGVQTPPCYPMRVPNTLVSEQFDKQQFSESFTQPKILKDSTAKLGSLSRRLSMILISSRFS